MNENVNEQIEAVLPEQNASVSNGETENAEISLGKFKNVNALMQAYNSLQAEFTKRCQKLKELEEKVYGDKNNANTSFSQAEIAEINAVNKKEEEPANVSLKTDGTKSEQKMPFSISEENKLEILKDYLKGVVSSANKAIVMDAVGVGVKTPVEKPKTILEAGVLAKEILIK